jgi:hypothetical protein
LAKFSLADNFDGCFDMSIAADMGLSEAADALKEKCK